MIGVHYYRLLLAAALLVGSGTGAALAVLAEILWEATRARRLDRDMRALEAYDKDNEPTRPG